MPCSYGTEISQVACKSDDCQYAPLSTLEFGQDDARKGYITKWFKPAAQARATDAYWDPVEECVKNTSDKMLVVAMADNDDLYWANEKLAQDLASPKQKWVQVEEESLDNTMSTIKSGLSTKKHENQP